VDVAHSIPPSAVGEAVGCPPVGSDDDVTGDDAVVVSGDGTATVPSLPSPPHAVSSAAATMRHAARARGAGGGVRGQVDRSHVIGVPGGRRSLHVTGVQQAA
jgi:hypothetical protein